MFQLPDLNVHFDYELQPKDHPLSVRYRQNFFVKLPEDLKNLIDKITTVCWDETLTVSFDQLCESMKSFLNWQWDLQIEASKQHSSRLIKFQKIVDPMSFDYQVSNFYIKLKG